MLGAHVGDIHSEEREERRDTGTQGVVDKGREPQDKARVIARGRGMIITGWHEAKDNVTKA